MSAKESTESTENTGSTENTEKPENSGSSENPEVTVTGGGLAGVLTAAVTYEVTGDGTAEISYLGQDEDGRATLVRDAELPWKQTVQVPLGETPTVAVVLGEEGGQAACTLAIRGKHVQRATAVGEFGRTTCTGELPADGT